MPALEFSSLMVHLAQFVLQALDLRLRGPEFLFVGGARMVLVSFPTELCLVLHLQLKQVIILAVFQIGELLPESLNLRFVIYI